MTSPNSPRRFPPTSHMVAGRRVPIHKIECFECGESGIMTITAASSIPDDGIANYFRRKGWNIGKKADRCVCPKCVAKAQEEQRAKVKARAASKEPEMPAKITAMSRDDRRIIYAELEIAYGNGSYKPGKSDASVAKDLGVPVQWVEEIRDGFFGPARDTAEADAMLARADEMQKRMLEEVEAMRAISDELLRQKSEIDNRVAACVVEISRLATEAKKIAERMVA